MSTARHLRPRVAAPRRRAAGLVLAVTLLWLLAQGIGLAHRVLHGPALQRPVATLGFAHPHLPGQLHGHLHRHLHGHLHAHLHGPHAGHAHAPSHEHGAAHTDACGPGDLAGPLSGLPFGHAAGDAECRLVDSLAQADALWAPPEGDTAPGSPARAVARPAALPPQRPPVLGYAARAPPQRV
jgi:hypothetical protein